MRCQNCGTETKSDAKFCHACGTSLVHVCRSCGGPFEPGDRFCAQCGAKLDVAADEATLQPPAKPDGRPTERRLVSVLFADLVNFTPLAEDRDSEEVRELQSRYFETARTLVERYGGTVEKFIGDAVMAVWGTPTATEDDAERAVRAALDLTSAVPVLGEEVGAADLRARAGVLTGEAAVALDAEGEGMVAGDVVNTAARIQAAARAGQVYVGESTRRATDRIVVYEDAGSHELKGKSGLIPLWRALRVVSGARGSLKAESLEAPFVGRERELRLIKSLFHTTGEESKAHLVSITGIAGIGKSRLAWEFFKYMDGLPQSTYWHRGRCLSYGEGVAYWALADMVRMRARIAEDEEPASALQKLRATLQEHLLDEDERKFVEPRLAHLLGLEERNARDKQELFGAWRIFFERLAETYPTVLVFEDMQWADASLLDFVEYLLEWSRSHPLYVVTLARPELLDRRSTWGAGRRNFTSLYLEPLSTGSMQELLAGLVPGLPAELTTRILERAEGIPLYAVETVRMLLDRGLLAREGSVYRPVGPVETLEVPETLHALIAARLDGLTPDERRVLQDGAVLGKTFTRNALAALSNRADAELDPILVSLARKEVLSIQADPRSPEHGQYGFLQDLVRRVAYDTLSKRERRTRHLAAAEYLRHAFAEEEEIVEVLASHYVEAFRAAPDADDAGEVKANAREMLTRAGERASSLAAANEAKRYFEVAADLADDPLAQAELLHRAARMSWYQGIVDESTRLFETAIALYESEGDTHGAARASGRLGEVEWSAGRITDAVERMERAFAVVSTDPPDEDIAELVARLAHVQWFAGDNDGASHRAELALDLGESLWLPGIIARALQTKGIISMTRGHLEEAAAYFNHSLKISLEHDVWDRAEVAYFLLSDNCFQRDRFADALDYLDEALAVSRRAGGRLQEWEVLGEMTYPLFMLGRWAESVAALEEIPEDQIRRAGLILGPLSSVLEIYIHRGDVAAAEHLFDLFARLEHSSDVQELSCYASATAALRRAQGRHAEAVAAAEEALGRGRALNPTIQSVKQALVEGVEAALALGDVATAECFLQPEEDVPVGRRSPYLEAQVRRFQARIDGPGDEADENFRRAAATLRELGLTFWLGVALVEHSESLLASGRDDEAEPLRSEAREIFARLEATPWVERATAALPERRETAAVS
jgi:class 3 adenylate cyclase/tetratricopeptide (TPR) repeat protein